MKKIFTFLLIFVVLSAYSQKKINVVFIGNSYTSVNNLPQMITDVALSAGDTLKYLSNTPGGCTFNQHCSNNSMALIQQGSWDFVVLQEQSQYPSFPIEQVESECFPYANRLADSVYANNPCGEVMFYMTWGRKYGDAANGQIYPPLSTYEGMDSLLYARYMIMAENNNASVCPVGRVWKYLRTNHPEIELYNSDNSHPSLAGSYAASCAFYSMLFKKDPTAITFVPASLDANTAQTIRNVAKNIVFDDIETWEMGNSNPVADFDFSINENIVTFTNNSKYAENFTWDFGDESNSNEENPNHSYNNDGSYSVSLIVTRKCVSDTITKTINIITTSLNDYNNSISIYPNPAKNEITISNLSLIKNIEIYDITGKMTINKFVNNYETKISIEDLPKGIYMLHINNFDNNAIIKKIVKL